MQNILLGSFYSNNPHMITFEGLTVEKLSSPFALVSLNYIDLSFSVVFSTLIGYLLVL